MTPEQVQARLAFDLPPATLVLGPGSWREVCRAARGHWMMEPDLSADRARILRGLAWLLPTGNGQRVMALGLDGSSALVQNMLLKALEDSPATTRFVLAAQRRPLPTVVSRCRVLVLGGTDGGVPALDAGDVAVVGTALRAACSGRAPLLAQALRNWLPVHARLLNTWAVEAVTGRWRVFGPAFAPDVRPEQAYRLLGELARYPGSRLGALAALDKAFCTG